METVLLKDYIAILRKHIAAFITTVIVSMLLAGVITYLMPQSYTSSLDLYVRHKGTENTQYYTYDGYYSTQASVAYTDTVAGFLESLSTVNNAAEVVQSDPLYRQGDYKPTDLSSQTDYLAKFQKNITVRITAPELINVSVSDSSSTVSQLWAQALGTIVTTNLKQLNQEGDSNYFIDATHAPITQTNKLSLTLDLIIGAIIGVFLGFTVGFMLEANKRIK